MIEDLTKALSRLKLAGDETVCFISHHKGTAKDVAVIFHMEICRRLNS